MKFFRALLLVAIACRTYAADSRSAVGLYVGSSGIESRTLDLGPHGEYVVRWDADIGSNGLASGKWFETSKEVALLPELEEGPMMKGHFRVLLRCEYDGKPALLRKEDLEHRDNPYFYLFLQPPKAIDELPKVKNDRSAPSSK